MYKGISGVDFTSYSIIARKKVDMLMRNQDPDPDPNNN